MKRRFYLLGAVLIASTQLFAQQIGEKQHTLALLSATPAGSIPYGVFVHEDLAFITNNDDLLIFDVHDAADPVNISAVPLGVTSKLTVSNKNAYTVGEEGLFIIDVSDPVNPEKLGHYRLQGIGKSIWMEYPLAFIATSAGLEIIDISVPSTPAAVAHCGEGPARGVAVADGVAYVANRINGLTLFDVSDPAHPVKLSTIRGTGAAWNIHVDKDYLYLGRHQNGVDIFDISDRQHPRLIANFNDDDGGEALSVWGEDAYLYVADNAGMEVLDIRDPSHPGQIAEMGDLGCTHDIVVNGNRIYIASAAKGLLILEFDPE